MCETVDTKPHALTPFDREMDAIRQLLGARGVMGVDELRRGIEALPEPGHHRLSYYGRWIHAIADVLVDKGVFAETELAAALAAAGQGTGA